MNALKELRSESGLTQEEYAKKIGISLSALAKMEQGIRRPSVKTAKMIANKLGISWTIFFEQ